MTNEDQFPQLAAEFFEKTVCCRCYICKKDCNVAQKAICVKSFLTLLEILPQMIHKIKELCRTFSI